MTERTTQHATFTIERLLDASPARAFKAFADVDSKAQWFVGPPGWEQMERVLDFRVGGFERVMGTHGDGKVFSFDAYYIDIVPDERIIYAYDMYLDDAHISVSLATVEFKPAGGKTRLVFTEQAAFLDGFDDAGRREQGSGGLFDQLEAYLKKAAAA